MAADTGKPSYVYKAVGERQLKVDVLYPPDWKEADKRPGIVFFSGGAFRSGGTAQFRPQAEYFAKRGMVTVRAEYRDSTKDKVNVDTCLRDALSAMRWVRKNAGRLGVDPDRIVSSGGSAGGYLASAVCTVEGFDDPQDDLSVSPKPNAMVLFNPVVDFPSSQQAMTILGGAKDLAERLSPLGHLKKGLPPTLIMLGSEDPFYGQVDKFVTKGKELGARVEREVYDGQPHAFFNRSPWLEKTALRADDFLRSIGYLAEEPKAEPPTSKAQR
jgi:acetyl esterase/lipase